MAETAALRRALRSMHRGDATSEAMQGALQADTEKLGAVLGVHAGMAAELDASEALIRRLKEQDAADQRLRDVGVAFFALVVIYVWYERIFLNFGGALLLRTIAWLVLTPATDSNASEPERSADL